MGGGGGEGSERGSNSGYKLKVEPTGRADIMNVQYKKEEV